MPNINVSFAYPRNVRFHCTRCTLCCGNTQTRTRHILVLRKEAKAISEATSKPVNTFAHRINGHEPYVFEMRKRRDGKCVFLECYTCVIYASRPLICRYYPFELKSQIDGKCEFSFTSECPGVASGRVLKVSYFRALFRIACERLRWVGTDVITRIGLKIQQYWSSGSLAEQMHVRHGPREVFVVHVCGRIHIQSLRFGLDVLLGAIFCSCSWSYVGVLSTTAWLP